MNVLNGTWNYFIFDPIAFLILTIMTIVIEMACVHFVVLYYELEQGKRYGFYVAVLFGNMLTALIGYVMIFPVQGAW